MTKEEFQELLQRYKAGNCSLEELHKINNWFDRISNENLELSESEKKVVGDRMLVAIRQSGNNGQLGKKSRRLVFLKVAASVAILIVAGALLFPTGSASVRRAAQNLSHASTTEYKNNTDAMLRVQLPDSSTVELAPGAEIAYAKAWGEKKREVHLVGEAFFNVTKNPQRPFYVYGGEVVTKVLGTSFTVKAAAYAKSIEVAVRTGKVSVYKDMAHRDTSKHCQDDSGVILTPNERVEYFVDDRHWVTSLVAQPRPLPAANKAVEFVFNATPMSDIVKSVERTYSIDIIMENEAIASCAFTGDVSMMELYDMLEVICKSTATNYEVKGTKILITGYGCQ